MTLEQKISILIRKYGSKSIIRDNDSGLNGDPSTFVYNRVLPKQIWIDLKSAPQQNPLKNSPTNLSKWPSSPQDPIIVKIIKKKLTWIKGTNAFYDPGLSTDLSTVEDIISPDVDLSYYPEIYILNTESNEYLKTISPNKYDWIFDYESGCLVFPSGLPSFMKSPEFQPPAVTCYRYVGRKTASGISSDLIEGDAGPTGPTGPTGETRSNSVIWRGAYDASLSYSKNDATIKDGVVFIKKTGPTGPDAITSAIFDSVTYNEFSDGFIEAYNEQYVDLGYTSNSPYFETLDDASLGIITGPLKTQDHSIRIFNLTGPQEFNSDTGVRYSNRLFFNSPKKLTGLTGLSLNGSGYRSLIIDGLYTETTEIQSTSFFEINRSRVIDSNLTFSPNSSIISTIAFNNNIFKDITGRLENSFFSDASVTLNASTIIDRCTFNDSTIFLGDQGINYYRVNDDVYNGVVHYFKNTRFIDTNFIAQYSGEYRNVIIVLDKCFLNYTEVLPDNGFTFPNIPNIFLNRNCTITMLLIDTIISTLYTFNFLEKSTILATGTNHVTPVAGIPYDSTGFFDQGGFISRDPTLTQFLAKQNTYIQGFPGETTNFYYNQ